MKTPPVDLADRLLAASAPILDAGAGVRFDDIAEQVGVARATLYYYFSGRDDLLSFVLAEHIRRGAEIVQGATGATPTARLRAAVTGLVEFLGAHPELCPALLSAMGGAGRMSEALQANDELIARPVAAMIRDGIAAGELRAADPDDLAASVLGSTLMIVLSRTVRGRSIEGRADARRVADVVLRLVVPG